MTIAAYRQMRADPPPDDLYVVPEDFDVDAYKRQVRRTTPPSPQEVAVVTTAGLTAKGLTASRGLRVTPRV